MSLNSMTGFARSDGAHGHVRWHWELKTVNGRSMDVRCRLPHGYEQLEPAIRKLFAKFILRGNCQVSLSLKEEEGTSELTINTAALQRVVDGANHLVKETGASAPSADGLLALKGVLELSVQAEDDSHVTARNSEILKNLEAALVDLVVMRKTEGAQLGTVIMAQMAEIEKLMVQVRQQVANTGDLMRTRIASQVAQLMDASKSLDEDRLYQEAVILASKADITEELDRLDAHILAAKAYLNAESPIGRKLEFLIQEFNRETNTLCSKSPSTEVTALGLDMKAAIDQIREQVMNIE